MRAMRYHDYGGPEGLREDAVERPVPAEGEALVEVAATSVNPADWQLGAGHARRFFDLPMPFTPGMDFAGIVREVGSGTLGVSVGDRVFGANLIARSGTYAEFVAVPAAIVARAPDGVASTIAAAAPLAGLTAWEVVLGAAHGNIRAGQCVLIHGGAGGVGTFAVQLAKQAGARVIATGSTRNHDLLLSLGADEVIDYHNTRFEESIDSVDAVIDLVGGNTVERSIPLVREGGVLASIVPAPDQQDAREATAGRHGVRLTFADMSMKRDVTVLAEIGRRMESGALRAVVSETIPLMRAAEALAASRGGHVRGKIALVVHETA